MENESTRSTVDEGATPRSRNDVEKARRWRIRLVLVCAVALVIVALVALVAAGDNRGEKPRDVSPQARIETATSRDVSLPNRQSGGRARVVVSSPPTRDDRGQGGATLRQLTRPDLFVLQPDGSLHAGVVEPTSDKTSPDARSATFRLRSGAQWSDGSPITVTDLRRSVPASIVTSVSDPADDRTITVNFAHPYPTWRQLWSGDDAIIPSNPEISGGPYMVKSADPSVETTLVRNEKWYGVAAHLGPFLDEIVLQYVYDPITARQLLAAEKTDVVVPAGDTERTNLFQAIHNVKVETAPYSGVRVGVRFHPDNVPLVSRRALSESFGRVGFTRALTDKETSVLTGIRADAAIWDDSLDRERSRVKNAQATYGATGGDLATVNLGFVTTVEQPLGTLLGRAVGEVVAPAGGKVLTRSVSETEGMSLLGSGSYDALVLRETDEVRPRYKVLFANVDDALGERADSGDNNAADSFETKLRDDYRYLPLWRERAVVAWRSSALDGVRPNGFREGAAWNANEWHVK